MYYMYLAKSIIIFQIYSHMSLDLKAIFKIEINANVKFFTTCINIPPVIQFRLNCEKHTLTYEFGRIFFVLSLNP